MRSGTGQAFCSDTVCSLRCALLRCGGAAQTIRRAPAFADAALVAPPTDELGDERRRLVQPPLFAADAIDRSNVASLKGVWRTHLRGSGLGPQYSGEAQPIVYEGVIYVVTGANDVFAVSVDSGEILWEYRANLDPANNAVCCGWTSRGVGLGDGKIYVGQLDGKLVALDQRTGSVAWSVQAERWQEGFSITSAPLYFDGLVYTGFAGGERGIRGRVKAFDARDGKLVWTFYTIPGPGEVGHDTWPQDNEIWMDGGAPVWNTPAVDPELGLIYFATGNPGPDYNGSIRRGDNLFSTSIVAVDAKTGAYRWHFQEVHHDIWDYDAAAPVTLFDIELNGVAAQRPRARGQDGLGLCARSHRRHAAHRHRRAPRAARAAARHRGDAAVPARRRVHSAADRHRARGHDARQRRQDLHAVLDHARADEAGPARRRELAAELVRRAERLPVRLRRRSHLVVPIAGSHGRAPGRRRGLHRRRHRRLSHDVARRVRGRRPAQQRARLAAALARPVLQRLARDGRRPRVRRPQRRPADGARLGDRHEALGIPNRRRHELAGHRRSSTTASSTSSPTPRATSSRAPRAATASGCSAWTARSSRCRRRAR